MSDFSEHEDYHLVALAREYEDRGRKVSWSALAAAMAYSKKDAQALKRRLTTLKTTHGKLLRGFPSRFFKSLEHARSITSRPRRHVFILPYTTPIHQPVSLHPSTLSGVDSASLSSTPVGSGSQGNEHEHNMARTTQPTIEASPLSASDCGRVVAEIFAGVAKSDVRQAAGRTEFNVGELATDGVTDLVDRCQLRQQDVFLDVGSGVGNVITQVVLQTAVARAIGIEIRTDVASLGSLAILEATTQYPRLSRASNRQGDVLQLAMDWSDVLDTTVLYANNFVFTPEASHAVHHLCCVLPGLRMVVLGTRACPRHRNRCMRELCLLWREEAETLSVRTEYRHNRVALYVYTRPTE